MKKITTVFIIIAAGFISCSVDRFVATKQNVVFDGKSFRKIGEPGHLTVNKGDTLQLLITNRKIKLKNK